MKQLNNNWNSKKLVGGVSKNDVWKELALELKRNLKLSKRAKPIDSVRAMKMSNRLKHLTTHSCPIWFVSSLMIDPCIFGFVSNKTVLLFGR